MRSWQVCTSWLLIALSLASLALGQQYQGTAYNNSMPYVPGAEITFWKINDGAGGSASLLNYITLPNGKRQDPKLVKRAVVVLHGLNRDPGTYMSNMLSALSKVTDPAVNPSSVAIIAPYFSNGDDKNVGYPWTAGKPAGQGSTSKAIVWKGSGWASGLNNQYPYNQVTISSYDVLDQMLQYLDNKTLYPNLNQIVVAGHSLGAQMANRYASVGKQLRLSTPLRYWIGNPNSWLWYDLTRPAKDPAQCPSYDDWRNGLSNYGTYNAALVSSGRSNVLANFQSRSIIMARGTQDFGDDSSDCAPFTTGANRGERFYNMIKTYPPQSDDNVDYVNIGHDAGYMFASSAGRARLFTDNFYGDGSRSADFGDRQMVGDSPTPDPANAAPPNAGSGTGASGMSYQGCFSDDASNGAALSLLSFEDASNSVEKCTAACSSAGYGIAGMSISRCFCGNRLAYTSRSTVDPGCSSTCPGNSQEYCGADQRLSVWSASTPLKAPTPSVVASVGTFTSLGCWTEAVSGRALGDKAASQPTNTVESCAAACSGYQYFGVEYGSECYCGNTPRNTTAAPATDCQMICAGNEKQFCGGSARMNLYNSTLPAPSPPPSTPSPTPTPSGYKGCYAEPGAGGRALGTSIVVPNNTPEACLAACNAAGFSIAGAEYGSECWCGNSLAAGTTKAVESDCNMACAGSSASICGAGNRLSVYSTSATIATDSAPAVVPAVGSYLSQGCWTDNVGGVRSLAVTMNLSSRSVEACAAACSAYVYFGLEYGGECYCGNTLAGGSTQAPDSACSMPCAAAGSQICGAGNLLSLYKGPAPTSTSTTTTATTTTTTSPSDPSSKPTGTTGDAAYRGCWTDGGARSLSRQAYAGAQNDVATCRAACSALNLPIAGLEYGTECWCGSTLSNASTQRPDSECSFACLATPSQRCGAGNRLSVYSELDPLPRPVAATAPSSLVNSKGTTWSSLGCLSDKGPTRTLSGASPQLGSSNSLDSCAAACDGYKYFGTEYGGECYCGNVLDNSPDIASDSSCSFTCPGNPAQLCGAGNLLNVYLSGSASSGSDSGSTTTATSTSTSATGTTTTTSTSTSTNAPLATTYSSLGCYVDAGSRSLPTRAFASDNNSPSACASACSARGFRYSGTEYSSECFCGNYLLNGASAGPAAASGCNMPCSGDSTQTCGGSSRLSIVEDKAWTPTLFTVDQAGKWKYSDCIIDDPANRVLNVTLSVAQMTPEKCLSACADKSLSYCGLEYSGECFGSQLAPTASTSPSAGSLDPLARGCNYACAGNSTLACGGASRITLYAFDDAQDYTSPSTLLPPTA